jgi:hypothetical protein
LCTGRSIVTRIDKIDRWIFEKNYAINMYIEQVATTLMKHLSELVNQIVLL